MILGKDHVLHENFHDFAFSRVEMINSSYMHTPENMLVEPAGSGYVARYRSIDPLSITIEVKKTDSGQTPFIGVLRYIESLHENMGQCRVSVLDGPFRPVQKRRITEIFRYVQDSWQ
ncbi:MAG: hypothetical protein ACLFP9_00275 [Desulfonatronovibrio sp.]